MKLFYTDEKLERKLIGEFNDLESAAQAILKDMGSKFCYSLSDIKMQISPKDNLIHFSTNSQQDLGYSIEQ